MGWDMAYDSKYAVVKDCRLTMPPSSRQKELDEQLAWKDDYTDRQVVKSAMVGSIYYAALKIIRSDDPEKVIGVVALTCGRRSYGTLWGFKLMSESEGPDAAKCPASILDLLTPTDSKWANDWRKRCRENLQHK